MARGKSLNRDEVVALFNTAMAAYGICTEFGDQDATGAYPNTHAFVEYNTGYSDPENKGYRVSVRGGDAVQGPLFKSYQGYVSLKTFVLTLRTIILAATLVDEVMSNDVFLPEGEDEVEAAA